MTYPPQTQCLLHVAAVVHALSPESWIERHCLTCSWSSGRTYGAPGSKRLVCPACGAATKKDDRKSKDRRCGMLTRTDRRIRWIARPQDRVPWDLPIGSGAWTVCGSLALDYQDHDADVLAALLAAEAVAIREDVGLRLPPIEQVEVDRLRHRLEQVVGREAFTEPHRERGKWRVDDLIDTVRATLGSFGSA